MLVKERLEGESWVPPWLRHQHLARYEWAGQHCAAQRVLDAACGNGYGSRFLSSLAWPVSLDIAPEAVAEAQAEQGPALRLLIGDTTALPFASGSFDAMVSFETIEHVRDDRAYVREARRVVRPGGLLLCSTPNRLVVNAGNTIADPPFNPFHVREYDADELRARLRESFDEVTMMGQSGFGRSYVGLLARAGGLSKRLAVRLHQLRKLAFMPLERRERHKPRAMAPGEVPEVLVAVCR